MPKQLKTFISGYRVIVSLGFGVVTYVGAKASVDWFISSSVAKLDGLPADLLGVLSLAGLGNAISIITSAITVRLVLAGLNFANGKLSQFKFGGKDFDWSGGAW